MRIPLRQQELDGVKRAAKRRDVTPTQFVRDLIAVALAAEHVEPDPIEEPQPETWRERLGLA